MESKRKLCTQKVYIFSITSKDKIHPSLKMALLKEEMISDTSYISLLEIKAIEKLELQTDFRVWDR